MRAKSHRAAVTTLKRGVVLARHIEVGFTASFTKVVAASAQKQAVTVAVVGEWKFQVPAGNS